MPTRLNVIITVIDGYERAVTSTILLCDCFNLSTGDVYCFSVTRLPVQLFRCRLYRAALQLTAVDILSAALADHRLLGWVVFVPLSCIPAPHPSYQWFHRKSIGFPARSLSRNSELPALRRPTCTLTSYHWKSFRTLY